jgi:hypothetical protein
VASKNQITANIQWDTSYNGIVSSSCGTIHLEPVSGSTIYSNGTVDINFNNGLATPNNMTSNTSPSPYVVTASSEYEPDQHAAYRLYTQDPFYG